MNSHLSFLFNKLVHLNQSALIQLVKRLTVLWVRFWLATPSRVFNVGITRTQMQDLVRLVFIPRKPLGSSRLSKK